MSGGKAGSPNIGGAAMGMSRYHNSSEPRSSHPRDGNRVPDQSTTQRRPSSSSQTSGSSRGRLSVAKAGTRKRTLLPHPARSAPSFAQDTPIDIRSTREETDEEYSATETDIDEDEPVMVSAAKRQRRLGFQQASAPAPKDEVKAEPAEASDQIRPPLELLMRELDPAKDGEDCGSLENVSLFSSAAPNGLASDPSLHRRIVLEKAGFEGDISHQAYSQRSTTPSTDASGVPSFDADDSAMNEGPNPPTEAVGRHPTQEKASSIHRVHSRSISSVFIPGPTRLQVPSSGARNRGSFSSTVTFPFTSESQAPPNKREPLLYQTAPAVPDQKPQLNFSDVATSSRQRDNTSRPALIQSQPDLHGAAQIAVARFTGLLNSYAERLRRIADSLNSAIANLAADDVDTALSTIDFIRRLLIIQTSRSEELQSLLARCTVAIAACATATHHQGSEEESASHFSSADLWLPAAAAAKAFVGVPHQRSSPPAASPLQSQTMSNPPDAISCVPPCQGVQRDTARILDCHPLMVNEAATGSNSITSENYINATADLSLAPTASPISTLRYEERLARGNSPLEQVALSLRRPAQSQAVAAPQQQQPRMLPGGEEYRQTCDLSRRPESGSKTNSGSAGDVLAGGTTLPNVPSALLAAAARQDFEFVLRNMGVSSEDLSGVVAAAATAAAVAAAGNCGNQFASSRVEVAELTELALKSDKSAEASPRRGAQQSGSDFGPVEHQRQRAPATTTLPASEMSESRSHLSSGAGLPRHRGADLVHISPPAGRTSHIKKKQERSCSNCHCLITPQWRFIESNRYCNACYMRHKRLLSQQKTAQHHTFEGSAAVSPTPSPRELDRSPVRLISLDPHTSLPPPALLPDHGGGRHRRHSWEARPRQPGSLPCRSDP